ncbi:MAG TPA: phospholipase D-like domain-containing protein [Acetobacteraceae bacterium]|nr:phospholipase D-like domain-containing protein [Acetobacteraceae bacterium]
MTDPVLRPGATCWRIARADRMAVIVDAAAYFSHLKAAILQAQHSVLMIGWDFDTRVQLDRDGGDPAAPDQLGRFLSHVVRRNRQVQIHVLRWDLAFLKMPIRGMPPLILLDWLASPRLHFRLDRHHPAEACHHQKIVVIDDALAFCGGIDITIDRWDTPAHRDDDPQRLRPGGAPYGPWHDVTTAVDGAAARALGDLARARWQAATGRSLPAPPPDQIRWPGGLEPAFRDVDVAIARTEPAYDGQDEVHEIEALYLAAIASAKRCIYLESQYFSSHRIAAALGARLAEPDGPEVVIVNPHRSIGWLEEEVMGSARALLLGRLRAADRYGRLRFCTPVTEGGADIYVHAKVLVVDDALLRVGSSNINNRSMGLDTECDLAVEVDPDAANAAALRAAILEVRDALVSEHLGVDRETLRQTLDAEGGSLARTLDRLIRPAGRSLRPFTPPALTETEQALAETHALDPGRPESMAETFIHTMHIFTPRHFAANAAGALARLFTGSKPLPGTGG